MIRVRIVRDDKKYIGEFEFKHLPRLDEHIVVQLNGIPSVLKVDRVVHLADGVDNSPWYVGPGPVTLVHCVGQSHSALDQIAK